MAEKPHILTKLDWLIAVSPYLDVIYISYAEWKPFFIWFFSCFDRSKRPACSNSLLGCTDTGEMKYRGLQVRLSPAVRVQLNG